LPLSLPPKISISRLQQPLFFLHDLSLAPPVDSLNFAVDARSQNKQTSISHVSPALRSMILPKRCNTRSDSPLHLNISLMYVLTKACLMPPAVALPHPFLVDLPWAHSPRRLCPLGGRDAFTRCPPDFDPRFFPS